MCMIDDCDDHVTLMSSGDHTARKQHRCAECGRHILPGEKYHADQFIFEGKFSNHKTCAHCMVARGWLGDECGGWAYGAVEEDLREHVTNHRHAIRDDYGISVARLVIGMQWQWRAPSGRLLPIPVMPLTTHDRLKDTP